MHKAYQFDGQFYVKDVGASTPVVPVDNFVFITSKGIEVKYETINGRSAISWTYREKYFGTEWFDTYSEGLRRLADVLEGRVSVDEFAKEK